MFRVYIFMCLIRFAYSNGGLDYLSLNNESLSNQACASIINDCLLSGYNFIYDSTGNVAFASLSPFSTCDSFVATAVGNEQSGTLTATSYSGLVQFDATYSSTELRIPISNSMCTLVFDIKTYVPNTMSGSLSFEYDNGDSSCRVTECQRAGYNYIYDSSSTMYFASRAAETHCPLAIGSIDTNGNELRLTQNYDNLALVDITSDVTGIMTINQVNVTIDAMCMYTYIH